MTVPAATGTSRVESARAAGGGLWARIDFYARFGIFAGFVVTVLSLFGAHGWLLELLTHFRLQLASGSILLLLVAALRRHPLPAALAGITAVANLAFLLPYVWPQTTAAIPAAVAAPQTLRILMANVNRKNDDYDALRDLVHAQQPDVVGLLEANRGWQDALSNLSTQYPYRVLRPQNGAYGILLYSRLPLEELPASPYRRDGVQAAVAVELDMSGTPATFVLAHLMSPVVPSAARLRDAQLADLARMFEDDPNPAGILIGDLNITPWSPEYAVLERPGGLANAALGRGYRGTWPVQPAFLRIPIDHCLVSDAFRVADLRTGPDIGSDHFPLIVDLVPQDPPGAQTGQWRPSDGLLGALAGGSDDRYFRLRPSLTPPGSLRTVPAPVGL